MTDHLTWELDIDTEEILGIKLASLCFTTGCGQVNIDHYTPDALRALSDQMQDHARVMDGRCHHSIDDLKKLLEDAHRYIGCYPHEVPDGLIASIEIATGINRHEAFDGDGEDAA